MSDKIYLLSALANILLFVIVYIIVSKIYTKNSVTTKAGTIKKSTSIWRTFDAKTMLIVFVAAVGTTYFLSNATRSGVSRLLIFILLISLLPYAILNNINRSKKEAIFNDVILYCSSMGMLLKQTKNVYSSLEKVAEDVNPQMNKDIHILMSSFEENKEVTQEVMKIFETNYPYTCVQNLDLIMIHMFYENANLDEALFSSYQDDISILQRDIKMNRQKRLAMRIQYFGISAACIILYNYFYNVISDTYQEGFETVTYNIVNAIFIFGTLITLFFVDRYFNANTTKE